MISVMLLSRIHNNRQHEASNLSVGPVAIAPVLYRVVFWIDAHIRSGTLIPRLASAAVNCCRGVVRHRESARPLNSFLRR